MGGLSWWHWLIILAAFILLFGAKKLPDAARGVGRSSAHPQVRGQRDARGRREEEDRPRRRPMRRRPIATPVSQITATRAGAAGGAAPLRRVINGVPMEQPRT